MHLTVTRDHGPETNKGNRDENMSKDDDQIINHIPLTSHVPLLEEDQDFDHSDDVDDLTMGPVALDREKSTALSEDSENTRLEVDKDFKDAKLK